MASIPSNPVPIPMSKSRGFIRLALDRFDGGEYGSLIRSAPFQAN